MTPMKTKRIKYRKRAVQEPNDRKKLSVTLREIARLVQHHRYAHALTRVNRELETAGGDRALESRLLGQVADSEFKRGDFEAAAQIYTQAGTRALAHHTLWLRPAVGQVRALLKSGLLDDALVMARHACQLARYKEDAFQASIQTAERALSAAGQLRVGPRPPRFGVVATRMGTLFLQEGELGAAAEFYHQAMALHPQGACRAHQGMACIALAEKEYMRAYDLAAKSIRNGAFGAKTLAGWATLIAARRAQGGWQISENLLAGLSQTKPSVRARAVGLIVRELRKRDMRQWRSVARTWLAAEAAAFPIAAAELHKMLLASAVSEVRAPGEQLELAHAFLRDPTVSALEWLAVSKIRLRALLAQKRATPVEDWVADGRRRYGAAFATRIYHGLARVLVAAGEQDRAADLFQRAVANEPVGSTGWGRAVWARARLEVQRGRPGAAAAWYQRYAASPQSPERFRIQAKLEWIRCLVKAGTLPGDGVWRRELMEALAASTNVELVLDTARQLRLVDDALANQVLDLGEAKITERLGSALHPSVRLNLLFLLTRRQVGDFGRCEAALRRWERLTPADRDQLWSEKEQYWEYQAYLLEACWFLDRDGEGEAWARRLLTDLGTPSVGRVQVGISYGQWLMGKPGRAGDAARCFRDCVTLLPGHARCTIAHLWLAMLDYRRGDLAAVAVAVQQIRAVLGSDPGLRLDQAIVGKAALLAVGLQLDQLPLNGAERERFAEYREEVLEDIARWDGEV